MIYHYTDADGISGIHRAGEITPRPVVVCTALVGGDSVELAPAIWLTTADRCPTVEFSLVAAGYDTLVPGALWRVGVADSLAPLTLPAWAAQHGYPPERFRWIVLTASLAGEDWRCWRVRTGPILRADWLSVERLVAGRWQR